MLGIAFALLFVVLYHDSAFGVAAVLHCNESAILKFQVRQLA